MTIKLDKTLYAGMVKTSGEMLESILEQVKVDLQGAWNYSNAQALGQLSEDLAAMGKPLKLCQPLKGLSMLSTAPWTVVKPEQTGKTVYQFSRLGYSTWASTSTSTSIFDTKVGKAIETNLSNLEEPLENLLQQVNDGLINPLECKAHILSLIHLPNLMKEPTAG